MQCLQCRRDGADLDHPKPGNPGDAAAGGHKGHFETEARCLGKPAIDTGDPTQLTRQSDFAEGDNGHTERPVERRRGHGDGRGEVCGRIDDADAADRRNVDLLPVQFHARPTLQDGEDHGHPACLDPVGDPPRYRRCARGDQGLHLGQQGTPARHRNAQAGSGRGLAVLGAEQPAGIGHLPDAGLDQLEAPHLVRGAEAVLRRPQHPEPTVPVTLERQHDVHEVLQGPRPGDGALLGDVAHEDHRHGTQLGDPHQGCGHLLDLGDAARRRIPGNRNRLHRVEDEKLGSELLDVPEHNTQVVLCGKVEAVRDGRGALCAQPHLGCGLLGGDVQGAPAGPRPPVGHLEQQGRLPDSRLAGQKDDGPGGEARPEYPVELGDAGGHSTCRVQRHFADQLRRLGGRRRRDPCQGC